MSVKVEASSEARLADLYHRPALPQPVPRRMQDDSVSAARFSPGFPRPETAKTGPDVAGNAGNGGTEGSGAQQTASQGPLSPTAQGQPPQASPPSGPMRTQVVIPPRPRPGRKPIPQEDAADRRRLQNRIAQRNFRDKRQQKLFETQQELEDRRQEYLDTISHMSREMEEVRNQQKSEIDEMRNQMKAQYEEFTRLLQNAEHNAEEWKSKYYEATANHQGQLGAANTASHYSNLTVNTRAPLGSFVGASVPTPPEDNYETDFTNYNWRSGHQPAPPNALRSKVSTESFGSNVMDITKDPCGFCTDLGNCACEMDRRQQQQQQQQPQQQPTTAPGTCDACLADPQRAAACRELARGADLASGPSIAEVPKAFDEASPSHAGDPQRTSCRNIVNMIKQNGVQAASVSELFGGKHAAYPSPGGSGFEVAIAEHEAAQALQNLSRRDTQVSESITQGPTNGRTNA